MELNMPLLLRPFEVSGSASWMASAWGILRLFQSCSVSNYQWLFLGWKELFQYPVLSLVGTKLCLVPGFLNSNSLLVHICYFFLPCLTQLLQLFALRLLWPSSAIWEKLNHFSVAQSRCSHANPELFSLSPASCRHQPGTVPLFVSPSCWCSFHWANPFRRKGFTPAPSSSVVSTVPCCSVQLNFGRCRSLKEELCGIYTRVSCCWWSSSEGGKSSSALSLTD